MNKAQSEDKRSSSEENQPPHPIPTVPIKTNSAVNELSDLIDRFGIKFNPRDPLPSLPESDAVKAQRKEFEETYAELKKATSVFSQMKTK